MTTGQICAFELDDDMRARLLARARNELLDLESELRAIMARVAPSCARDDPASLAAETILLDLTAAIACLR